MKNYVLFALIIGILFVAGCSRLHNHSDLIQSNHISSEYDEGYPISSTPGANVATTISPAKL